MVDRVVPLAAKARMVATRMLVIDEVTSLSADFFTRLDAVLKKVRGEREPFGGLVLLLSGDSVIVYPVRGQYAFASPAWDRKFGRHAMVLSTNVRHAGDPAYLQMLLRSRLGTRTRAEIDLISKRQTASPPPDCTWLSCAEQDAIGKNAKMLGDLPGPDEKFVAVDTTCATYLSDVQAGHLLSHGT